MRIPFIFITLCSLPLFSFAQNDPVPAYLTTQHFPDSVRNLQAVALNGEELTFGKMLDQYKGKKVVIDIWASWCRDCLVGYPKLDDLMKRTAGEDLVYLFVSVDDNDQKWRNAISRFSMTGEHYRLPSGWKNSLSSYIVLDWVPRYMVVNEDGRIVEPKTITSEEMEKALKK